MKPLILTVFLAASLSACVTPAAVIGVAATAITTVHQACSELSAETKATARQINDGKPIICEESE